MDKDRRDRKEDMDVLYALLMQCRKVEYSFPGEGGGDEKDGKMMVSVATIVDIAKRGFFDKDDGVQ